MTMRVALSLGSNMQPDANLRSAITALRDRFGQVCVSSVYRFPAVGFVGPDFLNAAAVIETDLSPSQLNDWLHALEDAHGRDRTGPRYGDRPLDIDIVLFGDKVLCGEGHLQIPRDELAHAFVLKPLAEIAPAMMQPVTGRTMLQMWRQHPEHDTVFAIANLG